MQQWQTQFMAVLTIFTIAGIGALLRKLDWLSEQADKSLFAVTVRVLFPALILKVTLGNELLLRPGNLLLPPAVGFITIVAGFAIAYALARAMRRPLGFTDPRQWRTFALCVGMYNYGYVPLPLAEQLFGGDTVAILFVHNLGVEIAMWTVGITLVSGRLGPGWWRRIINPVSLSIAVAVGLTLIGVRAHHLPRFVRQSLDLLGASAVPLSVLLVGAVMQDEWREARFRHALGPIALGSILRLGILPAGFLLLAWAIPASRELKQVMILQAAMPCAVFPVVLSRHFGGDPATALRVILGTSLLSLATMPLWLLAGLHWVSP